MDNKFKAIDVHELIYIESDTDAYTGEWNNDYEKGFSDCLDKILALPTIEAQPVSYGRWEFADDGYLRCTHCNQKAPYFGDECIATDFCPSCGYRMEGGY